MRRGAQRMFRAVSAPYGTMMVDTCDDTFLKARRAHSTQKERSVNYGLRVTVP